MVRQMGPEVAPGGTLFLVGHRLIDPATGAATPAAGQVQVSIEAEVARSTPAVGNSLSPRIVRGLWLPKDPMPRHESLRMARH